MKSKFRFFSVFAAFACVLASGFTWGGTPIAQCGSRIYKFPEDGTSKAECLNFALTNAASVNAEVTLLSDISEGNRFVIPNKVTLITGKHGIGANDGSPTTIEIVQGGDLSILSDGVVDKADYNFKCSFILEGGRLNIDGGVYRVDADPIVVTRGCDSNSVFVANAKFYGRSGTAIRLDSPGLCVLEKGMEVGGIETQRLVPKFETVEGVTPEYRVVFETNYFATGIEVMNGDLRLNGAVIRAQVFDLVWGGDNGAGGWVSPTGGVCQVCNSELHGMENDSIIAVAGIEGNALVISNSLLQAKACGVRLLRGDGILGIGSTLEVRDSEIETARDGSYAITDEAQGAWAVELVSGTFYRMNKALAERWVDSKNEIVWEPKEAEDNVRMTVREANNVIYTVEFVCNTNGISEVDSVSKTNDYRMARNATLGIDGVTPASLGVENDFAIFTRWYNTDVRGDQVESNEVHEIKSSVNCTNVVYAGWKLAEATFFEDGTDTALSNRVGLVPYASGDRIDLSRVKPADFDWDLSGRSFQGWMDADSNDVRSLTAPVSTNLYAKWKEMPEGSVFQVGDDAFFKSDEIDEAIAAAGGTNTIFLVAPLTNDVWVGNGPDAFLDLQGFAIGAEGVERTITVDGTNAYLQITGSTNDVVYGVFDVKNGGALALVGGRYASERDSVITASGTNYYVEVAGALLECQAGTDGFAVFLDGPGETVVSNSTIRSEGYGISVHGKGVCTIVGDSLIVATHGVDMEDADVMVLDSKVQASQYVFEPTDPEGKAGILTLSGANVVNGGTTNSAGKVVGGLIDASGAWSISISGGTYAHVASNEFSSAWIASGCEVKWLSSTCFTVINPLEEKYTITYGWTVPEGGSEDSIKSAMTNYPAFYTTVSNVTFVPLTCVNATNDELIVTADWYLSQLVTAYTNCAVKAIENGKVIVLDGTNAVYSGVSCTNITLTTGKWSDWGKKPTPVPTDSIHIDFGTGVADPDFPEDPESEVMWNCESEEYPGPWPTIAEEYEFGYDFPTNSTTHSLPSATWGVHKFSGWVAYVIDYDDDGNPVTNRMAKTFVDTITLDELRTVSDDYNGTLHAVWDQGGGDEDWNPTFNGMYNDERDKIMTGGDTYVGFIIREQQDEGGDVGSVIGKIVVKLGTPKSDGSIGGSIKVTINGKGSRSFSVKKDEGEYHGSTVSIILTRDGEGEDDQHDFNLTLDSKTITGWYNGYEVVGGVDLFKGSESDRAKAESAISPFLGRWMFIFATTEAETMATDKHGEAIDEVKVEDGEAHAWGYSYVGMEIRDKGKVRLTGKLANGLEVSATATAIIGDKMMCVPATCAVYSGKRGGGFGFTAYFRNGDSTNDIFAASLSTNAVCEAAVDADSVSLWDSTMSKKMPFSATVVYTNWQRVADIEMPNEMLFCVDPKIEDLKGLLWNFDRIGEMVGTDDEAEVWLPLDPLQYQFGYSQYIDAIPANDGTYKLKVRGKTPKMKLVDDYIVPSRKGDNYAGVKLKYDNKRGTFSGSFKVYTLKMDDETFEYHLKKTKVSVSGAMADGRGWGFGHHKKAGSQPITLEDAAFSNRTSIVDGAMIDVGDGDVGEEIE